MNYIVIQGNCIIGWFKYFKAAYKEAIQTQRLDERIPVYVAKLIVKDGVAVD